MTPKRVERILKSALICSPAVSKYSSNGGSKSMFLSNDTRQLEVTMRKFVHSASAGQFDHQRGKVNCERGSKLNHQLQPSP
jgi:hypothetical protein